MKEKNIIIRSVPSETHAAIQAGAQKQKQSMQQFLLCRLIRMFRPVEPAEKPKEGK